MRMVSLSATVSDDEVWFAQFWAAYPLKVAKKDARKAWGELRMTPELHAAILAALAWQGPQWAAQGYGTPYPATWLRGERWTDEPPPVAVDRRVPTWAR
jgi:hypothetical protein